MGGGTEVENGEREHSDRDEVTQWFRRGDTMLETCGGGGGGRGVRDRGGGGAQR